MQVYLYSICTFVPSWGGGLVGWSAPRTGRFTPGNDPVPIVPETGWVLGQVWMRTGNHAPNRIQSPDCPVHSFISSNLIHTSYINYIKLNSSTCFERHPPILRRSMSLIVPVRSLWYSHSLQVAVLCTY